MTRGPSVVLKRTCIYGVDFSGARDAGRRIWIARGVLDGNILCIEDCRPGEMLPGSSSKRDACLCALRDLIFSENQAVIGLDFPFGLPGGLPSVAAMKSWEESILSFATSFRSPDHFRDICRRDAGNRDLKRETDNIAGTPWSPYNWRLRWQTFYGIRDVLAPLVKEDTVRVLPMQDADQSKPWLVEICPASTLKAEGLHLGYKGKGETERKGRQAILTWLEGAARIRIPTSQLREEILGNPGGDALDSLVAAVATARALRSEFRVPEEQSQAARIEGYVYC